MAKKKNKMSTGDAVKVLANEMKMVKQNQQMIFKKVNHNDLMLQDYIGLFERYIEHTKDGAKFIEKMKKLVDDKKKELEEKQNEQQANESADGQDTSGDKQNEGVRAEGVCTQEG